MANALKPRFSCPECGRTIFNRRIGTCEFCSAVLPQELKYSAAQLATIEQDHQRNEMVRKRIAREAEELERQKVKRRGDGG
jgi:ribosomal protein L37E